MPRALSSPQDPESTQSGSHASTPHQIDRYRPSLMPALESRAVRAAPLPPVGTAVPERDRGLPGPGRPAEPGAEFGPLDPGDAKCRLLLLPLNGLCHLYVNGRGTGISDFQRESAHLTHFVSIS